MHLRLKKFRSQISNTSRTQEKVAQKILIKSSKNSKWYYLHFFGMQIFCRAQKEFQILPKIPPIILNYLLEEGGYG